MANTRNGLADKREFIKISQAVGVGFVVMGALGYIVKLSMCPSFTVQATHVLRCGEESLSRRHRPRQPADYC